MKFPIIIVLAALFCTLLAQAEPRTFTATNGKTLDAELMAVVEETAMLKLNNGRITKVPLNALSDDDQSFIKTWWEENKNNLRASDARLKIEKNSERIKEEVSKDKSGKKKKDKNNKNNKMSKDEYNFTCTLESYTQRKITDITAEYKIYKRVTSRGETGSSDNTEEISGSSTIPVLEPKGIATFDTDKVICEDSSSKGTKGKPDSSKRETVIGFVVTFSAGGKEFLKQSYPDNFLDRLKEEEKREARE